MDIFSYTAVAIVAVCVATRLYTMWRQPQMQSDVLNMARSDPKTVDAVEMHTTMTGRPKCDIKLHGRAPVCVGIGSTALNIQSEMLGKGIPVYWKP